MVAGKQGLVFISCGQYDPREIKLGEELAKAVDDLTDFEGYFAQDQASLDGVSRHIFGSLNRCSGFVAVMHARGAVKTLHGSHTRASVWVEQEIAIAAFLEQAQGRKIPVAVYFQRGVKREGVRDQLLLGPVEFDKEDEVLADFRARLGDGRFTPIRVPPPKDVALRLDYVWLNRGKGDPHRYQLKVTITNTGTEALKEYWVKLQFPTAALDGGTVYGALKYKVEGAHTFFRADRSYFGTDLYPEDPVDAMSINYHMDHDLLHDASVLALPVIVTFGAPGMALKRAEKPFRELQEF